MRKDFRFGAHPSCCDTGMTHRERIPPHEHLCSPTAISQAQFSRKRAQCRKQVACGFRPPGVNVAIFAEEQSNQWTAGYRQAMVTIITRARVRAYPQSPMRSHSASLFTRPALGFAGLSAVCTCDLHSRGWIGLTPQLCRAPANKTKNKPACPADGGRPCLWPRSCFYSSTHPVSSHFLPDMWPRAEASFPALSFSCGISPPPTCIVFTTAMVIAARPARKWVVGYVWGEWAWGGKLGNGH